MHVINNLKQILKKLNYIMSKKQKKKAVCLIIIVLVGSIFETLGVSIIMPFIEAVMIPEALFDNAIIGKLSDIFNWKESDIIWITAIFIISVYVVKNIVLLISSYAQASFRCRLVKEISVKMLNAYLNHSYIYFTNINSGKVIRGIYDDVGGLYFILEDLFKGLAELLTALFIAITLFIIDPTLAIGLLFCAGVTLFFVIFVIKKRIGNLGQELRKVNACLHQYTLQIVGAIKEIMVAQKKEYFTKEYSGEFEKRRKIETEYSFIGSCPERIIETVCICGLIVMIVIRVNVGIDSVTFISKMGAFAVAAFRILPSMSRIAGYINNLVYYIPMLNATYENVKEADEYVQTIKYKHDTKLAKLCFEHSMQISDINWKYGKKNILNNVNLEIKKGESIAFIGASGAGKTTLADIILGVLRPQAGTVKCDDKDIYENLIEWSKIVAYVPQNVYLFDDTIKANVAFGIDSSEVDESLVWDVLEQAQLKEFVLSLPEKLNTIVGERGIKFSGGQRQRIAIARALYHRPEILVLDEATSALDNDTEKAVMSAIDELHVKITMIIVAHRLTTVEKCDKIYEFKDGNVAERNKFIVLEENK